MKIKTKLTKLGRDPIRQKGFINPGIYKGSTMIFNNFEDYINDIKNDDDRSTLYGINKNPSVDQLEKAISNLYPEWDVWTKFLLDDTNRAFELDALDSSHPIEQEVKNPDEIGQLFDAISYSKGASLIRMLENYIGEEKFKTGIQQYIVKHQYKNTITNDLWDALSKSSNKDIKTLMEQWTTKSGFPLILVSEES